MSATPGTSIAPAPPSTPSFFDEFKDCWRRIPDKTAFAVLFGSWLAIFQLLGLSTHGWTGNLSLLDRLWEQYGNPDIDMEYAKLIPPVILALLWHKRERLAAASIQSARWQGLIALAVALLFHLMGVVTQQEAISNMGLFLGTYGLLGVVWGWGVMKESFFPMFLLAFCIPLGSIIDDGTFVLRLFATRMTEFIAHTLLGVPLLREGTTLKKPEGGAFEVVAGCSGLHSFTALLVLTIIYAMTGLSQFWKRALIIAATVPLALGCNVVRLVAMVVADRAFGSRAGHFVHDIDWIFTYGLAVISIMILAHWLREKQESLAA